MKRILPIGILLMLSYSLPAFGTSSPRPVGMTVETCTVDGLERTYRLYLPEGVPDNAPLVFVLHGYGGNFNLDRYGMNEAADRHGFAVCYPQGVKDGRGKPAGTSVPVPGRHDRRRRVVPLRTGRSVTGQVRPEPEKHVLYRYVERRRDVLPARLLPSRRLRCRRTGFGG